MSLGAPLFRNGIESEDLKRYAFILKLRPGVDEAHDEAHRSVSPELIALLNESASVSTRSSAAIVYYFLLCGLATLSWRGERWRMIQPM